jgi:hypothetical protein
MRALSPLVLVLLLTIACGGKIAPDADSDRAPPAPAAVVNPDDDIVMACTRPRGARLNHTCSTSCQTTNAPDRAFTSAGDLLDFMQTRWIACSSDVAGLAASGIAFHDGCNFSWLVDGAESASGGFAIASLHARSAEIVLHADGLPDDRLIVSMSECPNQLRVTRNDQTTYLMAE